MEPSLLPHVSDGERGGKQMRLDIPACPLVAVITTVVIVNNGGDNAGVLFRRSLVCLSSFLFSASPHVSLPLPRCRCCCCCRHRRCSNQTGSVGRPAAVAAAAAEEKHVSLTESRTSLLFCSRFELKQTNRQKA